MVWLLVILTERLFEVRGFSERLCLFLCFYVFVSVCLFLDSCDMFIFALLVLYFEVVYVEV